MRCTGQIEEPLAITSSLVEQYLVRLSHKNVSDERASDIFAVVMIAAMMKLRIKATHSPSLSTHMFVSWIQEEE